LDDRYAGWACVYDGCSGLEGADVVDAVRRAVGLLARGHAHHALEDLRCPVDVVEARRGPACGLSFAVVWTAAVRSHVLDCDRRAVRARRPQLERVAAVVTARIARPAQVCEVRSGRCRQHEVRSRSSLHPAGPDDVGRHQAAQSRSDGVARAAPHHPAVGEVVERPCRELRPVRLARVDGELVGFARRRDCHPNERNYQYCYPCTAKRLAHDPSKSSGVKVHPGDPIWVVRAYYSDIR
jgi:hypothetical protein